MAFIMCSGKLWRQLNSVEGARSASASDHMPDVNLGSWAAKVFTEEGQDLVLALETRTYLTLLFRFSPGSQFRANFAAALVHALQDARIPLEVARRESAAIDVAPLLPLRNRQLTESLNDIEFFCGIEFAYHDDLRTVQRNLNEIPHPNRDVCVPKEAIKRLFCSEPIRSCTVH